MMRLYRDSISALQATLASPWTQALVREVSKPTFSRLPPEQRPYLLAALLFAATSSLLYVGNAALLRYGLPWSLVSLLLVLAAANLWGVRPAVLLLTLSAFYGAFVVPHLSPPSSSGRPLAWHVLFLRTLIFVTCGATTVWLTYRARQMQEKAEHRRAVVAALQSMMLPARLPQVPGYDLEGLFQPAHREEEVGGDFYDFYCMDAGMPELEAGMPDGAVYGLLIGDVMGKGKEAAALTAFLRYSVRALSSREARPAHVLAQLNTLIETQTPQFETASLFLGFLDIRSGEFCYANAGHEPPLLRRADGSQEILDATGPIIGVGLDMTYEEKTVHLRLGDALLLMTDGVTEARNAQGIFLESDGAWRLFQMALRASSAQKALACLVTALTTYIGTRQCDDIAMLLLRRVSAPADTRPERLAGESSVRQMAHP